MRLLRRLGFSLVMVAALASGCADSKSAREANSGQEPGAGAGPQHIHGLGVRNDGLLIATHTGLWAAAPGQTKAHRLGASKQDIMGFAVQRKNRLIGSGHPDPSQQQPPNLGLIESRDGGRSWKNVSLLGQADFHVLESSGPRVYGFDGTQGRLMVSSDGGGSWRQRRPPTAMFSLAIDPSRADSVVTSTDRGLFRSDDAGKTFRPLRVQGQLAGLLAWPAVDDLFLVDGRGRVLRSHDRGDRWRPVGSIGGQPSAFIAHGRELYAALGNNTVKRSTDGGRSWTVRSGP